MNTKIIKALVDEQAADDGLWFVAETCAEAYLQQALRRLHAAIEDKSSEQCVLEAFNAKTEFSRAVAPPPRLTKPRS